MKIRIKNFGPIKTGYTGSGDSYIVVSKITLFIGDQGTGKSTVAKLISTFLWLEKAVKRGDYTNYDTLTDVFINKCLPYHAISDYLMPGTELDFEGDYCIFSFKNERLDVRFRTGIVYYRPKILYIPAERNFCSALRNPNKVSGLPYNLLGMLADFDDAKTDLNGNKFKLPVDGLYFRYDKEANASYISNDAEEYEIELFEASSGIQSVTPLSLTSRYEADSLYKSTVPKYQKYSLDQIKAIKETLQNQVSLFDSDSRALTAEQIDTILGSAGIDVSDKYARYLKGVSVELAGIVNTRFVNIVEEPEQNLFPSSQKAVFYELLADANSNVQNSLIITSHSPYIFAYLTAAVMAEKLNHKSPVPDYSAIVPKESAVDGIQTIVYQFSSDGSISRLEPYDGLPSDQNELNELMSDTNTMFAKLQELDD